MAHFIEEHLGKDTICDIQAVYTDSPANHNGVVRKLGYREAPGRAVWIDRGVGTTLPIAGEMIANQIPETDYASFDIYDVDTPDYTYEEAFSAGVCTYAVGRRQDEWDTLSLDEKKICVQAYLVERFMKMRQALTIDCISYNSHGMVMFGKAGYSATAIEMRDGKFPHPVRQLSTFNLMKLNREVSAVMFNESNEISLAIKMDELVPGTRGVIEYEIVDTSTSVEQVLETKRILVTEDLSDVQFVPLSSPKYIDTVLSGIDTEKYVELIQSESDTPIQVDDSVISAGDWFILNKTSRSVTVMTDSGTTYNIDPYGIVKASASSVKTVAIYRSTYARPSKVSINREGLLYKTRPLMKPDFINGFFVENLSGKCIYNISKDGVDYIDNGGPTLSVGQYITNISVSDSDLSTIVRFGDEGSSIYGLRVAGIDMFMSGGDVYVKRENDLDFEIVTMSTDRDNEGYYYAEVAGCVFKTRYDNPVGAVHRNKNFMYESNFIVSGDAVIGELIGKVLPIGFFRPERLQPKTCNPSLYPFPDGHSNSKNEYHPGEVAIVYSETDGEMTVRNNRYADNDIITYSFTSVLGRKFFEPCVVSSFGYVARDTMTSLATEHFLSKKIVSEFGEYYRKRYAGSIERETAPYRLMWTKFRNVRTGEETLIVEHEYDDEHASHLGHSEFLDEGGGCSTPRAIVGNRATYMTNYMAYPLYYEFSASSVVVRNLERTTLTPNSAVPLFEAGRSNGLQSTTYEHINGIRPLCVSAQSESSIHDTIITEQNGVYSAKNTISSNVVVLAIPKVGATIIGDQGTFEGIDVSTIQEEQIVGPDKRGVLFTFSNGATLAAELSYEDENAGVVSRYTLVNGDIEVTVEQIFPDKFMGEVDPYATSNIYKLLRPVVNGVVEFGQKCIPMYLANYLFSEYGVVQNIAGHWDESSGVVIDDSSIEFVKEELSSGFRITPVCSGIAPAALVDYAATLSMFHDQAPYFVSDAIRIGFVRTGYLLGIEPTRYANAIEADANGDSIESSRQIMAGIAERGIFSDAVAIAPLQYTQQGPWREPVEYSTDIEKLLLSEDLEFVVAPNSSIALDLMVGPSNTVSFNIPAKRVRRIYDAVDGYVSHDVIKQDRDTPLQRGAITYRLSYIHNPASDVLLSRDVAIDLEVYPSRVAYPTNNIIRELVTPIREDGHAKKMDSRSVFVRFDTRYISDNVHSYFEKFAEAPTAFTCDQLPEEALLNKVYYEDETMFRDILESIGGDCLVQNDGLVHLRFDNDSDEKRILKLSYSNRKIWCAVPGAYGFGQVSVDDIFNLFSAGLMFIGFHEEMSKERTKEGVRLIGTI
jgi:hypothetical protein